MSADILLQHLQKVKRTGQGRWMARCCAHDDKSASLSIRELDDGRVLVHCFASCSVEEVLGAVGLTFDALYPEKEVHHGKLERRPFPAADILRAIAFESTLILVAAADLLAGNPFNDTDRARLALACTRVQNALNAGGITQ